MQQLIHRIVTDIKFMYPCIAYDESYTEEELIIVTETKLSKVYPIEKRVDGMTSVGEDFWGRYSFIDEKEQYYCELDGQLYFKGNSMDGEPHYPVNKIIHYDYPNLDLDLNKFDEYVDKVKAYIEKETDLELVESKKVLKLNEEDPMKSMVFCTYRLKIN